MSDFSKGDFLIDFGQVFVITDIKKIDTSIGPDKLLIFKPYFPNGQESDIVSSIPQSNISKTTIRTPLSKTQLSKVLDTLCDKKIKKDKEVVDVLTAKAVLNQNEPTKIAETIRKIYLEKIGPDIKFTGSKNYIYQLLIQRLAEEMALVFKISPEKAQVKIENCLKKK